MPNRDFAETTQLRTLSLSLPETTASFLGVSHDRWTVGRW